MDIQPLIFEAKTTSLNSAYQTLDKVTSSAKRTETAVKKTGDAMKNLRGPTSALKTTSGQLAVQLQDVAVQAQMGTDYLRIFAQQGPQIASVFGPQGAVVGAVLAIGAAIGTVFVSNMKEAEIQVQKTSDVLKSLRGNFDELTGAQQGVVRTGTQAEIKQLNAALQEQNNIIESQRAILRSPINLGQDEIRQAESAMQDAQIQAAGLTVRIADLENALNPARNAARSFVERLQDQYVALGKTQFELLRYKASTLDLTFAEKELVRIYIDSLEAEEKRIQSHKDAKKAIEERIKAMAEFRKMVADEQKVIDERRKKEGEEFRERGREFRESVEEETKIIEERKKKDEELDKFKRDLAWKRKEYEDKLAEEQRRKDLERTQIYAGMALSIENKLLKGKTEAQKAAFRIGANLLDMEKRERAATIVSTSYEAAMKAYAALAGIPIVGPALGAGAAATILAAGVSYAAQSLAGRAAGGQVRAGESYVVGERGPEVLTMGSNGKIIPNDKLGSGQGQTVNKTANVTFNISANDTAGFDELIRSRRGQIIGIINEALNDQGRTALA